MAINFSLQCSHVTSVVRPSERELGQRKQDGAYAVSVEQRCAEGDIAVMMHIRERPRADRLRVRNQRPLFIVNVS